LVYLSSSPLVLEWASPPRITAAAAVEMAVAAVAVTAVVVAAAAAAAAAAAVAAVAVAAAAVAAAAVAARVFHHILYCLFHAISEY
jgi:hypothetical protein